MLLPSKQPVSAHKWTSTVGQHNQHPFAGLAFALSPLCLQVYEVKQYPKSPRYSDLLPIVGPESMLLTEGDVWKSQREAFNPGGCSRQCSGGASWCLPKLAPGHLVLLVACLVISGMLVAAAYHQAMCVLPCPFVHTLALDGVVTPALLSLQSHQSGSVPVPECHTSVHTPFCVAVWLAAGFSSRFLKAALPGFVSCTQNLVELLGRKADQQEVVQMHLVAILTTLEVICKVRS